jgi:hypothetical protein
MWPIWNPALAYGRAVVTKSLRFAGMGISKGNQIF